MGYGRMKDYSFHLDIESAGKYTCSLEKESGKKIERKKQNSQHTDTL